jgi:hypothetical protein
MDEQKEGWSLEELVRVGYEGAASAVAEFTFTEEDVVNGAAKLKETLGRNLANEGEVVDDKDSK